MKTSESVVKIAPALLKAQKLMGGAKKAGENPYFKSKYATLGAVLEASKELLNDNGIVILQPQISNEFGTFVETTLLHESGEFVSSQTKIVFAKEGDPQAQGSAISYARRYGLQSLLSMPAEDDDGEKAMTRQPKSEPVKASPAKTETKSVASPKTVTTGTTAVTNTSPALQPAPAISPLVATTPVKSSFKNSNGAAKPAAKPTQQMDW